VIGHPLGVGRSADNFMLELLFLDVAIDHFPLFIFEKRNLISDVGY
jgi:hypothetical protein